MSFEKINEVSAPIIYIGATLFFSTIIYVSIDYGYIYSYVLLSIFLIWIYLKTGKEFLFLVILTLIMGVMFNRNYYKFNFIDGEEVKITRIYEFGGAGEIRGRNVFIKGDLREFSPLDRVNIKGEFTKEIDKEFGRVGEIKVKSIKKCENIWNKVNVYKNEFIEVLRDKIGDRDSGIVNSVLFGDKKYLDEEDMSNMKKYGVIHVMSISGLHIGIIFLVLRKLSKEEIGLIGALIYVIITGMAFSSIRAFMMLFLIYFSFKVRKKNNSLASLSLSLIIIFMFKPYSVLSIGFLLSFGATLGIILFYKPIRKKLYKIGGFIGDTISISLSAQVFVLPILIYYFNEFSISFLVGNILLVPLINLILILGFIGFLLFKIHFIIDIICFFIGTSIYALDFILEILDKFSPSLLFLNEYYGYFYVSLLITYYFYKRGIRKIILLPISCIMVIGINLYSPFPKIKNTRDGLVVSYRGEYVGLLNSTGDSEKIKAVYNTFNNYRRFSDVNIKDDCTIKNRENDFILDLGDKEYLINLNGEKRDSSYDIIDFKGEKVKEIIIIKDNVLKIK